MKKKKNLTLEEIEKLPNWEENRICFEWTGYPIIKALPRKEMPMGFTFWCPFCKEWHRHGIGEGHRGAHCRSHSLHGKKLDSPFKQIGYIIKRFSKKELL